MTVYRGRMPQGTDAHQAITRELNADEIGNAECRDPRIMNHDSDILWPECETGTYIPQTVIVPNAYADTDQLLQEEIRTGEWLHDDLVRPPKFGYWPMVTTLHGVGQ